MAGNDQVDQDAIAAQWEASLDSEDPAAAAESAADNELSGAMALQWAAMVEDGGRDLGGGKNGGERVLSQEEIDNLLASPSARSISTTIPASAPSSIRRWCPTSACRCSKSCSTAWCG